MARAIWKGIIAFGDIEVPVKLYSAAQDRRVHFRLLHDSDHEPVEQRMVHAETGDPVSPDEVRRGYEVERGVYVLLEPDELEQLQPAPSRTIEIGRFVPASQIDPPWYDRPYWLGPDGDQDGYFALAEALGRTQRCGIAHWVMRRRAYAGALRAEGDHLALLTLRHAGEVIPAGAIGSPQRPRIEPKEAQLAEQLVGTLAEEGFDLSRYPNEYRERLLELIRTKAEGGTVRPARFEPKPAAGTLSDRLRQSIEAARRRVA